MSPAIARRGRRLPRRRGDALGRESDRLRVATYGGILDDAYRVPIGDVARARLALHTGAPRLNVGGAAFGQQVRMVAETAATRLALRAADAGGELIRASFVGPPPDVRTSDGTVTMRYRRRVVDTRSRQIDAALNPSAAWAIEIENGLTDLDADLRELAFLGLNAHGGVNHFRAAPAAAERDGADRDRRRRERGPALTARPACRSCSPPRAASRTSPSTASGATRRAPPCESDRAGYDRAPDRYEVEIEGGVSDLGVPGLSAPRRQRRSRSVISKKS